MNIIIEKKRLIYKGYKLKCSIGKSGLTYRKKEGDLKTPKGIFKLGLLYFRKDRVKYIKSKIKKRIIQKNYGWCDDQNNKKYNQQIKFPFKGGAEKLYRKDKIYDLLINIKYNQSPVTRGKGSAIFLHLCSNNYRSTKGCIAITRTDFNKIIPLIDKKTKILIK